MAADLLLRFSTSGFNRDGSFQASTSLPIVMAKIALESAANWMNFLNYNYISTFDEKKIIIKLRF